MKTKFKKILNIVQSLIQYIKTKAPLLISSATAACALLFALLPTQAWAMDFPHSPYWDNYNYVPYPPNPILDPIIDAVTISFFVCIALYALFYFKNKIEDIITVIKKKKSKK